MTGKTRYFVLSSLLVLALGVGAGLVAYSVGFSTSDAQAKGPEEFRFVPFAASLVAFMNVQDVMVSELRQHLLRVLPLPGDGQREFENETGISIERDVDRVVAAVLPRGGDGAPRSSALVLARGRFDSVRIETLMREYGGSVEEYGGVRLLTGRDQFSVAFLEPGLAALGRTATVRQAIDLRDGADGVVSNEEIMSRVRLLDDSNAWVVGRFDALTAQARLPEDLKVQLPPITWLTGSAHINGGIRGVLRAEVRDEEAATAVRDVVRGFLAFARLQTTSRPEFEIVLESLQLGGTGTTVALSFDLPATVLDVLFPSTATPAP